MFSGSFSVELVRELWLVPIYGLFVLTEMIRSAKPFDRRAWYFNWSYWPIAVLANAALFALIGLVQGRVLPFAEAHGLAIHLDGGQPELALLAWVFLYDFCYYWMHRLQHSRWLWPAHALHHADPAINATTTFRDHWLDGVVRLMLVYLPLGFVSLDGSLLTDLGLLYFIAYYPIFLHSNLPIGLGKLNWLIATPQTHRIHHSLETQHKDRNFATFFPIIDVVFGTYRHPERGEFPDTGTAEFASVPMDLATFNLYPFRVWAKAFQAWRQTRRLGTT